MSWTQETRDKLALWSQRLGVSVEELSSELQKAVEKVRQLYPDRDQQFVERRARRLLATKYARELRPRAQAVEGVFIAVGPKIDTTAAIRSRALALYSDASTRMQAISDGLVTPDGVVLDPRRELAPGRRNPNYGKPLQPFYQRSAIGLFTKFGGKQIKLMALTLRGDKADLDVPLHTPVVTRVNIRQESEHVMVATSSVATEFKPSSNALFANWTAEKSLQMLDAAPIKISPLQLEDYYEEHKDEPVVFAVVEGDLVNLDNEPTSTGNYRGELGDVEADIESFPASMFIPPEVYESMKDLGLGSRLIVVARLTLGVDILTGERTRVNLNPIAVFVKEFVSKEESLMEFKEVGA